MIEILQWLRAQVDVTLCAAPGGAAASGFRLDSTDVKDGATVPAAHVFNGMGCTGGNESPALAWHDPPAGTRSFAVTCYDPDAPTGSGWWHWQVFDIPASATGLPRGAGGATGARPGHAKQSRNDYGEAAYGGPCPPPGDKPHRYVFTVFALKVDTLDVPANASCALVGFMLNANKLGTASLTALYGR
jgi:Raf kinase inhibitor-like YbhB/YbcL family protein